ncbi:hypothetical protein AKJ16_DCAP10434 [Drosera capensis]
MAAACHAVLDFAVSVEGRQRLVEANGLVYKALKPSISVSSLEKGDAAYLGVENSKDKLPMLLLSAAVTLVNSCKAEQLEELPKKLFETLDKGDVLGCPLIYQQDMRVLRTDIKSKAEKHYFERSLEKDSTGPHAFIYMHDIIHCEDAYKLRYTIALRGMGFRFIEIAAISDKLAVLFGKPSTGANLYLTPQILRG